MPIIELTLDEYLSLTLEQLQEKFDLDLEGTLQSYTGELELELELGPSLTRRS